MRAQMEIASWLRDRFELRRAGDSSDNLAAMEGMRGVAVFLVFLVHFCTLVQPYVDPSTRLAAMADAVETMGNAGVDLFFVLSGYLIYGTLIRKPQSFSHFIKRRIVRIYPAFTIVFVVYLGLSIVYPAESKLPSSPDDAALYLVQNFLLLPGLFPIQPMITVAWSLSYEFAFYLFLPWIVLALRLRQWPSNARIVLILAMGAGIVLTCALVGGPVRMLMFLAGMVLHECSGTVGRRVPSAFTAPLALVFGLSSTLFPVYGAVGSSLKMVTLAIAFFVLCDVSLRQSVRGFNRLFHWTPVRWLGNMSYSYYLIHGLALKAAFLLMQKMAISPVLSWGGLVVLGGFMFVVTLIPAAMLFLGIERPLSLSRGASVVCKKAAAGA